MIRRTSPLGAASPNAWTLIPQREHARLSHDIAAAWGGRGVAPLLDGAAVRREFLAALLHHDDGWDAWWDAPGIDPERGRPYAFTEMPPAEAQRLWTASIEVCRAIGPLAGWVVAAHFSALQSKRDDDWEQWRPWVETVDDRRAEWLAEWLAEADPHTVETAEEALRLLQAFDWVSLWLCCQCPAGAGDSVTADLAVGGAGTPWPEIGWRTSTDGERVVVDPWPFATAALDLVADARSVAADRRYAAGAELMAAARPVRLTWRLRPA